jgi:hypothetical protein
VKALIGLAMAMAMPQALPDNYNLGFKDGGHLVLTRQDDHWAFEYWALSKNDEMPNVPVEPDKLHFVMIHQGGMTILIVTNGFKTGYRYKAYIGTEKRQVPTSTCTVMPGLKSFESWPNKIDVMLLNDFEPSNEMVCR